MCLPTLVGMQLFQYTILLYIMFNCIRYYDHLKFWTLLKITCTDLDLETILMEEGTEFTLDKTLAFSKFIDGIDSLT